MTDKRKTEDIMILSEMLAHTCAALRMVQEYDECSLFRGSDRTETLKKRKDALQRAMLALDMKKDPADPGDPEIEGDGRSSWWYVCPDCHGQVDNGDGYCRHCGKGLRWT